jgi:hypothetical protein
VITCARETWVLKEYVKQKLLVAERKILRGIFGRTNKRDGTRRIKINDELNNLIKNKNIISYIKTQRLSCFGHVYRMTKDMMVKKLYEWKPISTGPAGTPKTGWESDLKGDFRIMKINNWTKRIQDRANGSK